MTVTLFTGKGGVGKTTLAAVTAMAAARDGARTLVLSTDPAHSLADVLDLPLTGEPCAVGGSAPAGLLAAEVDIRGGFEAAWSDIQRYLVGMLASRGVAEVTAEEITVLPGAEEIISLLQVRRWADSGRFDTIVVDCAPTGETLRLLALPETLAFYTDRLFGAPAKLLRSLASGLSGLGLAPKQSAEDGRAALAAVDELLTALRSVRALLTDPERSAVVLVLTPERMVVAEGRRALTALSLHGYPVTGVMVNRVLAAADATGGWADTVRDGQQHQLREIAESFGDLPVREVGWSAVEPTGPDLLTDLADRLYPPGDPVLARFPGKQLHVEGGDGDYRLILPLPLARRSDVGLSRSGDDLIITVGPHRRRIALPSVLQRCHTTGARFDGDRLVIGFRPDPDRWPSALAGSL